jgi:hypothetical protein
LVFVFSSFLDRYFRSQHCKYSTPLLVLLTMAFPSLCRCTAYRSFFRPASFVAGISMSRLAFTLIFTAVLGRAPMRWIKLTTHGLATQTHHADLPHERSK